MCVGRGSGPNSGRSRKWKETYMFRIWPRGAGHVSWSRCILLPPDEGRRGWKPPPEGGPGPAGVAWGLLPRPGVRRLAWGWDWCCWLCRCSRIHIPLSLLKLHVHLRLSLLVECCSHRGHGCAWLFAVSAPAGGRCVALRRDGGGGGGLARLTRAPSPR